MMLGQVSANADVAGPYRDAERVLSQAKHSFALGFFVPRLRGDFYHKLGVFDNDERLESPREILRACEAAIYVLDDQIPSNRFSGLTQVLQRLTTLAPEFLRASDVEPDPKHADQWLLTETARQWRGLHELFEPNAVSAIPAESPCRSWFDCGVSLGCLSMCIDGIANTYWLQTQFTIRNLPAVLFEGATWLQQVRDATIDIWDAKALTAWVLADSHLAFGTYKFPVVVNDAPSLSKYIFVRIYNRLEGDDIGAVEFLVGTTAADNDCRLAAAPPMISWDQHGQQILINGVPVDQYEGTVVHDSGWEKAEFERNGWIYLQYRQNVTLKNICTTLKKMEPRWSAIEKQQGIRPRAEEFAKRLGLPLPAARRPGRRPHSKSQ
jgi:hypothetical protein